MSTDADLDAVIDAPVSLGSGPPSAADAQAASAPKSGLKDLEHRIPGENSAADEVRHAYEVDSAAPADAAATDVSAHVEPDPVTAGPHHENGADAGAFSRVGDDGQAGDNRVAVSSARTTEPFFSRDSRARLITILKGTHFSLPRQTRLFVKEVSGQARFTTNSAYDLDNADQHDWNKLTGITFTPFRPDKNAIMVAWRYNLTTQMFEIGPYYNVDLARIMPTPTEIISVPLGQEFEYSVDYNGITLVNGDQTIYKPVPAGLSPRVLTAVRISGWFGGTSVAPKTVSYYLNLNNRPPVACRWWCIADRPAVSGS